MSNKADNITTMDKIVGKDVTLAIPMVISEEYESKDISELDLSNRSFNALKRAKINTYKDLLESIENNTLSKVRNLGKNSVNEIMNKVIQSQMDIQGDWVFLAKLVELNEQKVS